MRFSREFSRLSRRYIKRADQSRCEFVRNTRSRAAYDPLYKLFWIFAQLVKFHTPRVTPAEKSILGWAHIKVAHVRRIAHIINITIKIMLISA